MTLDDLDASLADPHAPDGEVTDRAPGEDLVKPLPGGRRAPAVPRHGRRHVSFVDPSPGAHTGGASPLSLSLRRSRLGFNHLPLSGAENRRRGAPRSRSTSILASALPSRR